MAVSLLFTARSMHGGRHHGTKVTPPWRPAGSPPENSKKIPGLRPGIPWTEIRPASGRGQNAPAFGRGRLLVSEHAGKNNFASENDDFQQKMRSWYTGPPKSTSGPSFSESPRQTIWGPEVLVQIRALRTPFAVNQRSHPRGGNLLSVVRPC